MKGKVFIGWSGTNKLAYKVKASLEKENYEGVVGGQSGQDGGLYVGAVVLNEIDGCNQALFVVQKKENERISNNLMFELGYALAKFNANKIHVVYVDIDSEDKEIPSDLKGIWASHCSTEGDEKIEDEIVGKFLENQKNIIPEEKMSVIGSYYHMKEQIKKYAYAPHCSEYEFAQYILFFSQAAYMYSNEKDALRALKELMNRLPNPAPSLDSAVRFAVCYLELFLFVKKEEDRLFIDRHDFRTLKRKLKSIEEKVEPMEKDDFTKWFLVFINDTINYSHILYSYNSEHTEEEKEEILNNSIPYAEKCLKYCEELKENKANALCLELYTAYMYRNLSTAYKQLPEGTEKSHTYLNKSFEARKKLVEYYEMHDISTKLFDNFELEYYLALSECLEFVTDEDDFLDYKYDCEEYIKRVKELNREKSYFINKIERLVKLCPEE